MKKNKFLIVILLVVSILFVDCVSAATYKIGDKATISDRGTIGSIPGLSAQTMNDDGTFTFYANYATHIYSAAITSSLGGIKNYDAYCQDPYKIGDLYNKHRVNEVYASGSRLESNNISYYDRAIIAMLSYSHNNKSIFGLSDKELYAANEIALRAMIFSVGFNNSTSGDNTYNGGLYKGSMYTNTAVKWNLEQKATIDKLNAKYKAESPLDKDPLMKTGYVTMSGFKLILRAEAGTSGDNILKVAKAIYFAGIKAMDSDAIKSPSLTYNEDTIIKNDVVTKTIKLSPKNFELDTMVRDFKITKSNDLEVKCYSYVDGSGKNTLDCNNLGDLKLQYDGYVADIIIELSGDSVDDFCDPAKFTISYLVDGNDNQSGNVYIVYNSVTTAQRFIVFEPSNENKIIIEGNVPLCNNSCDVDTNINSDCYDLDNNGDDEWYDFYLNESDDKENCIINKQDKAGNSYIVDSCEYNEDGSKDLDNGMEGVAYKSENDKNAYCTVSCKEDYDKISFPGIRDTSSGRYFKIGAQIEATKTCYTSEIDYDKFNEDILKIQEEMVNAVNKYNKHSVESGKHGKHNCNSVCSGESYDDAYIGYNENGTAVEKYTHYSFTNGIDLKDSEEEKFNFVVPGTSGSTSRYCINKDSETKKCIELSDPYCSSPCRDGNPSSIMSDVKSQQAQAKSDLLKAQGKYEQAIKDIVACGGKNVNAYEGWDMEFPINPIIKYDYEENYMDINKFEDDNYIPGSLNYKDKSDVLVITDKDIDSVDVTYKNEKDDLTTGEAFNDRSFVYCTTTSCTIKTYQNFPTEELTHVEKSIDKELKYETPDVFYTAYPTGNVVYIDDYDKNKDKQVELINGLPVSFETEKGLYEFSFKIDNLGEYYDTCEGGRLIDIDKTGDSVDDVIDVNDFFGEYVCNYRINCPECDVDGSIDWDLEDCVTCLVDGKLNLLFRPFSNNKGDKDNNSFNPNDRPLGYNWNYKYADSNTVYGFIGGKANETLFEGDKAIYKIGSEVYKKDPVLTVELTPAVANAIRNYNDKHSNYANDTLTCFDYTEGGKTYKNIFCYSDQLTEWKEQYPDNFIFDEARNGKDNSKKYWEPYTKNIDEITEYSIGGPAWK